MNMALTGEMNRFQLYYDGQCALCRTAVRSLLQVGLLKTVEATAWEESGHSDPELAEQIRTEMVLVDSLQNSRYGGVDVLIQLMRLQPRWTALASILKAMRPLANLVYKTFAYNRRVLFPTPMTPIACTCDPPFHLGYRALLWVTLMVIAVGGSVIYGSSLGLLHPDRSGLEMGVQLTLAAGSGWALNFVVFAALLGKRYGDFVAQCFVVMAIGIGFLMGIALINGIGFLNQWPIGSLQTLNLLWVSADSLLMFWSQRKRLSALGLPNWAPWLWLFLLEAAGIPLFMMFKLFEGGG